MSDGNWDIEYDNASMIIEEAQTILKTKNLSFDNIATQEEIDAFNQSPRVREAKILLQKAKDIEG